MSEEEKSRINFRSKLCVPTKSDIVYQLAIAAYKYASSNGYQLTKTKRNFKFTKNMVWKDYSTRKEKKSLFKSELKEYRKKSGTNILEDRDALGGVYENEHGNRLAIVFLYPRAKTQVSDSSIVELLANFTASDQVTYTIDKLVVVYKNKISSAGNITLKTSGLSTVTINEELFVVNPQEHVYNNRYYKLSDTEKKTFYKDTSLSYSKIPMMPVNDPIARTKGWIKGDLIRIYNDNSASGSISQTSVSYVVISGPRN